MIRERSADRSQTGHSPPVSGPAPSARPVLLGRTLHSGQPPEGELNRREGDEGGEGFARFSKSLASRRLRPNEEKVRSTTQRRGGPGHDDGANRLSGS